jgi:hypothetical protein
MTMKGPGSLITLVMTLATAVHAIVIDDFTDGAALLLSSNVAGVTVLQTNLDAGIVIGGERYLYAGSQNSSRVEVDSTAGVWAFEATVGTSYFELGYGTVNPLAINLREDGSDAFLLSFSDVYTPGGLGASPYLRIDGRAYDLRTDLLGMGGGPAAVRIPFSWFSDEAVYAPERIRLTGSRIASDYRFVLESITTVPEPSAGLLLVLSIPLIWRSRKPNQTLEATADPLSS